MKNRILGQLNPLFWLVFISLVFTQCKTQFKVEKFNTQKNISIDSTFQEDEQVTQFIAPYKNQINTKLNEVIATASTDLTDDGWSSNLGNLLASVVLDYANDYAQNENIGTVDIAILNHGGMRIDIGEGAVMVRTVYELMPFENTLVLVQMTGNQINGFIDYMLQNRKGHPIDGITLEYENEKIKKALIQGESIEDTKKYWVATHNYLFNGGDNMKFFKANEAAIETNIKIRDIFIEEFRKKGVLPNLTEQRLIFR